MLNERLARLPRKWNVTVFLLNTKGKNVGQRGATQGDVGLVGLVGRRGASWAGQLSHTYTFLIFVTVVSALCLLGHEETPWYTSTSRVTAAVPHRRGTGPERTNH